MSELQVILASAPIVEAVVDIDCDMPNQADVEVLAGAAAVALADQYPTPRRRMLSEHQIAAAPGQPNLAHLRRHRPAGGLPSCPLAIHQPDPVAHGRWPRGD